MAEKNNQLQQTPKESANAIAQFLRNPTIVQRTQALLKESAGEFTAGLLSAVNANPTLALCSPVTVYNAGLTAAALKLPINNNLGFAYLVPYLNNKKMTDDNGRTVWQKTWEAQFQMGYRGFIQLAQRTGQYKRIACTPVYEGQLVDEDPLMGNTYDWHNKQSDTIVGYVSRFELVSGFVSDIYMSADQMEAHGAKYSQSYKADKQYKNTKSLWSTDFETMALKTVLKLNISKWGPMSVEMNKAIESDQAVIRDDGVDYIDGETVGDANDDRRARMLAADAKYKEQNGSGHTPKAVTPTDTDSDDAAEVSDDEMAAAENGTLLDGAAESKAKK